MKLLFFGGCSVALLLVALLSASQNAEAAPQPLVGASATCKTCTFLVDILHNLWGEEKMAECVAELVTYLCERMHIEDHFVCKGIASSFKDEFMYVISQIVLEPSQICGLFIADCGHFRNPLVADWLLDLPGGKPPHKQLPPPLPNKPMFKVLHITDLHIDRKYKPGAEAKCDEPQCCRNPNDPDELAKNDIKVPAGFWGTIGNCDAPFWLFTAMLDHIAAAHKDLAYVVVSGDLESHADWDYTRERHQALIRNVSATVRQRLPNTLPVIFAVGNHEGVPINSFAPHYVPEQFHMDWLYGTMADAWKGWVPADQDNIIRYNACFMRKIFPGLRIVSLNNGVGDSLNLWTYINQTDPDGTLAWLSTQLLDAEKAGDKVHIVAHIPGGGSEMLEGYALNYYRVINRFEDTVVAQFFGHTHSEEFSVFYEDPNNAKSRPTAVTWSAPSLTTYSEYNPAYRIYNIEGAFDGSNHRVVDWSEYFVDIEEANRTPEKAPEWKLLYASVLDEYGMEYNAPSEWSRLIDRMAQDDKLLGKYRKNYYRRQLSSPCDQACKHSLLCSARSAHHNETALCSDLHRAPLGSSSEMPRSDWTIMNPEAVIDDFRNFRQIRHGGKSGDDDKCSF